MWRVDDLVTQAESQGLIVVWATPGAGSCHRGAYSHATRIIMVTPGMTSAQTVSTLAHELGHAHYGDTRSTPALERRAWRYAARLLIDPRDYETAERLVGSHEGALAIELGVTVRVIRAWRALPENSNPLARHALGVC